MSKANDSENENVTFQSLGLCDELCEACERLEWKKPTDIQKEAIPLALKGHDIIGVSETGSGKTAAYALPIIHDLLQKPRRFFALILTPTRELAEQVADQFDALGAHIKIRCSVIIGGEDTKAQVLSLARKPHIIIATPGRLVDHLRGTKGFTLDPIKYLVFDEADRMLNDNFEEEINVILRRIPEKRQTYLFSATMTCKVKKLEKASLKNPVKLEVSSKYQTASTLKQKVIVVPEKYKEYYLCYLARQLSRLEGTSTIIFCGDWHKVRLFSVMFRLLDINAVALYGKMSQEKRNSALNKFKERTCPIMLATDLASRGLDIPSVDYVIVFDVPNSPKTYIHRVGRTARAGRSGTAYTFVTQFDMLDFPKIEKHLGFTMDEYTMDQSHVLSIKDEVDRASRTGKMEVRELERLEKKRKAQDDDDEDEEEGAAGGNDAGGAPEDVKKKKKFFKKRKFGKK